MRFASFLFLLATSLQRLHPPADLELRHARVRRVVDVVLAAVRMVGLGAVAQAVH